MSNDAGRQEPTRRGPKIPTPELVDVKIRRVRFEPPRHRHLTSALAEHTEAIEFRVVTDEAIPVDVAVPPVLYVGDVALTEMQVVGDREYVFLGLDQERLREGAALTLAPPGATPALPDEPRLVYRQPR